MQHILKVSGMSCDHCVNRVKSFLGDVEGVEEVRVDLARGLVEVKGEVQEEILKEAILDSGFEVQE